ncbi:hypothetical protein A0130_02545 [Leifsonia xyli]|nr:hypothetical protein A0130_02545 [Leifsonia xyli]
MAPLLLQRQHRSWEVSFMLKRTRAQTAAAALAVFAALTLTVAAPATADAKIKGEPTVQVAKVKGIDGQPQALVASGQPPTHCVPGRYKCPLGMGL